MSAEEQVYRVVAAVGDARQLIVLLAVAAPLARARSGRVTPVYVGTDERRPPWLRVPAGMEDVVEAPEIVANRDVGKGILDFIRKTPPDLLLLHWRGEPGRGRYLLGRTLDPVIQNAPCDVAVLRVAEDPQAFAQRMEAVRRVLVPLGGGPNASLALQIGLDLGPNVRVTAIRVANPNLGPAAISAQWELLKSLLGPWEREERLEPHVTLAPNVERGILDEAEDDCDMVLIGATRESVVDRLIFGNLPQQVATDTDRPVLIVRRQDPLAVATLRRLRWRLVQGLPQLTLDDRIEVYRQVRAGSRTSRDFYVLTIMSAAIASLGLLLDSTAVIIGAMLVAPLMLALLGVSLGIVQGDGWLVRVA
ncbi:MAG: universal stress protein, partial [Anaerolineae bacterium]|nr:universal stress protein [Anaerolineae bacterium]